MLPEVFYFLKGYVIIQVEGSFPEKFINIALKRNIYLWDIKRVNKNTITMKMSVRGYLRLKGIGRKCACRIKILGKRGMPFKLKRHKKRTAFFAGILLFGVAVLTLSNILWDIDIKGFERLDESVLEQQLEECGLKPGIWLKSVDTTKITQKLLAKNSELAWVGINIKGTKAFVEVVEGVPKPKIVEKDVPCNVVSTKSGVVEQLIVKNGVPVVEVGDTVEQGQLLVSGLADSRIVSMRYIHSEAEVKVRTWHEQIQEIPLVKHERIPTGNSKNKYKIMFGNFTLPLYFSEKAPYTDYDIQTTSTSFFQLPIQFVKTEQIEVDPIDTYLTAEEAFAESSEELYQQIVQSIPEGSEIVNSTRDYIEKDGKITVKVVVEAIEDAAEQIAI